MKIRLLFFCLLLLSACREDEAPTGMPTAALTLTPSPISADTLSVAERQTVENTYEALRQLHTQIADVWEGLAAGEDIQCGGEFAALAPETIPEDEALMTTLRQASIELENALLLWQAECQNPSAGIDLRVINRGVLMVRNAADLLSTVEQALQN